MKGGWVRATRSMLRGVSMAERAVFLVLLWPSIQLDTNVQNMYMVHTGELGCACGFTGTPWS